jgi:hypothetical protein
MAHNHIWELDRNTSWQMILVGDRRLESATSPNRPASVGRAGPTPNNCVSGNTANVPKHSAASWVPTTSRLGARAVSAFPPKTPCTFLKQSNNFISYLSLPSWIIRATVQRMFVFFIAVWPVPRLCTRHITGAQFIFAKWMNEKAF